MGRPKGIPATLPVGVRARYKPGFGVFGYEPAIEADGRIPVLVIGHTATRVRVEFTLPIVGMRGKVMVRCVDAASLIAVDPPTINPQPSTPHQHEGHP